MKATVPGPLTPRQREVLRLASSGATYKEIAHTLGVSSRTARNHLANLYQRLEVHTRAEAVMCAVRLGVVEPLEAGKAGRANASSTLSPSEATIGQFARPQHNGHWEE